MDSQSVYGLTYMDFQSYTPSPKPKEQEGSHKGTYGGTSRCLQWGHELMARRRQRHEQRRHQRLKIIETTQLRGGRK